MLRVRSSLGATGNGKPRYEAVGYWGSDLFSRAFFCFSSNGLESAFLGLPSSGVSRFICFLLTLQLCSRHFPFFASQFLDPSPSVRLDQFPLPLGSWGPLVVGRLDPFYLFIFTLRYWDRLFLARTVGNSPEPILKLRWLNLSNPRK